MRIMLPMRKATNLSVDVRLLRLARRRKINLSATLEEALRAKLEVLEQSEWLAENAEALNGYAEHVAGVGVFSDGLRRF